MARQSAELAALQAVTEVGLTALDLDSLLETLLERLAQHTGAVAGIVYLRQDGYLSVRKALGIPEVETDGLRMRVGEDLAGTVTAEGRPIAVPDAKRWPELLSPHARRHEMQALLGAPLRSGDRVIGAIELDFSQPREFRPEEVRLLEVAAERVAPAVERARLLEALRAEQAFLRNVLEHLPAAVAVIAAGAEHAAIYRNPAFQRAFGEVLGKPASEFFPAVLPSGESAWDKVFRTGEPINLPGHEHHAPGLNLTYWDLYFWPIRGADGTTQAVLLVGWEMTAHVQARRRIEELAQLAESRSRELAEEEARREQALSIVAHDLRGPVTTVRGYAQLLRRWERLPPEKRQEFLEAIEAESRRLERLIGDLYDASRIGAGVFEVRRKLVDLAALARRVAQEIQVTTTRHHIVVEAPDRLIGYWDEDRLAQALANLIGNAVTYSPEGGEVSVRVGRKDDEVSISVADHGVGLRPEELTEVFRPFRRGEQGRGPGGLDLGLYIARGIAEAHGGRIWAESEGPGKGSTFHVSLPVAAKRHGTAKS